jgi:hypothetical protein
MPWIRPGEPRVVRGLDGVQTNIGEEFPLDVQLLKARRGLLEEITRSYLTSFALIVAVLFLVGAAILGLISGSFDRLGAVWNALAAPRGATGRS